VEKQTYEEKEVQKRKSLESAIESTEIRDISNVVFDKAPLGDSLSQILDFDLSDIEKDFAEKNPHKNESKYAPKSPVFDANLKQKNNDFKETDSDSLKSSENSKSPKSSRKMQMDSKAKSIEKRIGHIESLRINLGMNKKELSDLLMVDPSAMNRWCKGESNAPGYIYQALEWYLMATEKHPLLGKSLWIKNSDLVNSLKEEDLELIAKKIGVKTAQSSEQTFSLKAYKWTSFFFMFMFVLVFVKLLWADF
tara:strand:- start:13437 stop:14189 length:753 start_codon:yes stop_codon:yes gene_type:complete